VLLAGFENKTGEAVFDQTLPYALAVQLGQSPFLNIVTDDRVRETLDAHGPRRERAADARARARGVPAAGDARDGARLDLAARRALRAAARGHRVRERASLAREQGEAQSAEQVLPTLGEMATRLRTRVGESIKSVQAFDVPVEQATTPSLEALRSYTLAIEQRRRGGEVEAIPFLERALELDPAFARRATTLSTVYGNLGEGSKSVDYARLAYAQRDRVSQRERLFIVYQYHDRVTGNFSQAADTLEVWKRTYPNDFQPPNALAIIDNRLGRYERGIEQAKDALVRTPGTLRRLAARARVLAASAVTTRRARSRRKRWARGVATVPTRRLVYQLAVMRGDAAAAARQLEWAKGKSREFDIVAAEAQVAAFSGQLRRASELYGRSVALADGQGLAETGLSYVRTTRSRARSTGVPGEALALARAGARAPGRARASDALPRVRLLAALGLLARPEAARIGRRARPADARIDAGQGRDPAHDARRDRARAGTSGGGDRGAARGRRPTRPARRRPDSALPASRGLPAGGRGAQGARRVPEAAREPRPDPFSPVCALAPLGGARAARGGEHDQAARPTGLPRGVGGRPTRTFRSSPSTRGAPEALAPDAARGRCIVTTHGARPVGRATAMIGETLGHYRLLEGWAGAGWARSTGRRTCA
jgi:tetratricopeptide (TPR) repeat protein